MLTSSGENLYGLSAEFVDAESLLLAAREARKAGYEEVRAYTPYWVEGLNDILNKRGSFNYVGFLAIGGLIIGALAGFWLQYYSATEAYQLNVGGRPLNSWQVFLLITFEIAVLTAALTVVGTFFVRLNLPLPYHPVFNTPKFELASRDRFFLCIEVTDHQFDLRGTTEFLQNLGPLAVSEVTC